MKKVYLIVLLSCLIAAIFIMPAFAYAASPLRVAVSGPYAPFAELDEQGNVYGFDVDIAKAICKQIGKECIIENVEFEDIIPGIVDGSIAMAVAGLGMSEERKALVDFTDRYYRSVSIFIEREGSFNDITPDSIKGKSIGAQAGSLQADYLIKTFGDDINLVQDLSYDKLFEKLKNKEIDFVFSDGLPGYAYLTSDKGTSLEVVGAPVAAGGTLDWATIAVQKGNTELREAINQALKEIRRSGEYDKINRKYFDFIIY